MPKEVVRGSLLPYEDDDPAEGVVEVRWSRDADYVQVVSRCVRRDDGSVYRTDEDEWRRAVDLSLQCNNTTTGLIDAYVLSQDDQRWLLQYLVGQFGAGLLVQDGFFVDVDRRGINALIRHLKRARDQAYGKDE